MRSLGVALLLLFAVAACGRTHPADERRAIWEACLARWPPAVLLEETSVPPVFRAEGVPPPERGAGWTEPLRQSLFREMPLLRIATWTAFGAANREPGRIDRGFLAAPSRESVSATRLRSLVGEDDDWSAFDRRYPDRLGLLTMSMPGVDDEQALVWADWTRDCFPGRFYLLVRKGASWEIVDEA